jgi:transglutaminase-like putative cysteine protease
MNTFPMLMAGALLFWGWETHLFIAAVVMAAALEGSRWLRLRWEFSDADLNRFCDLCLVLFLGAGLVLYTNEDRLIFIFKFIQWLPMMFFPIMLAQAYGTRTVIPLSAFSWLLRRDPDTALARKSFNISFAYFAVCLAAASASTQPNGYFYWGVSLLVLLALTSARPRRVSGLTWVALVLAVAVAGQSMHQQLRHLQNAMETALGGWLAELSRQAPDSRECRTTIGEKGRMKLSPRIVLRIHVPPGENPPTLLREAAYDAYKNQTWWATSNDFTAIPIAGATNDTIHLLPRKNVSSALEIADYLRNGQGLLPVPQGAFELDDLPAVAHTNRLGVIEIDPGPGLANFRASYGGGASLDGQPGPMDLTVPDNEKAALDQVADSLNLMALTERQKIRAVSRYFREHFTYTLSPPARDEHWTPLGQFLLKTKAGHCQYFATATVLLLREIGVRARYITGYAAPASAREGDTYLIRERHAHAWALVYHSDSKTWEQIDTTPTGWAEAQESAWWQPASDFCSNLFFQFSKWRWGKTSFAHYAEEMLVPLILYLLVRIATSQHRKSESSKDADVPVWPGLDSELFLINRRLSELHLSRLPHEPLAEWQRRLEEAFPASANLGRIFHLHRRLRFDPRGLEGRDRELLQREAEAWLSEHAPPAIRRQRFG